MIYILRVSQGLRHLKAQCHTEMSALQVEGNKKKRQREGVLNPNLVT